MRRLLLMAGLLLVNPPSVVAQPVTVAGRVCPVEIVNGRDIYVECGRGGYGLQFRPEGVYELTKGATPRSWRAQKLRSLPPELDPLIPSTPAVAAPVEASPDAIVVHRVLVAYTARAESAQGGPDNMLSLIVAAVAAANLTYTNSAVPLRLELADVAKVTYVEGDPATDLSRFRGKTDGYMDEIHARRDAVKADVSALIGSGWASRGACGIGYLMTNVGTWFERDAFSLTDRACVGQLTFVHELGHNQGLNHDPANASPTCPPNFNCGHRVAGLFRTVQSYGSEARIPYLSSPLIFYNSVATGTATRDNARRLRDTMATVANFRTGEPTSPPATPPPPPPQTTEQLSITSSSMTVAPGQPYTITCTIETTGLHETRCDGGWSGATTVNGVWTRVLNYTMNTTGRTHTVSAKLISEGASGTPITKSIFVAAGTQTCNPWTISPASATVAASGGTVPVTVTGTSGCGWTASSNASWITVSPTSGSGSGTATLTVAANPNTSQRLGTATVAGQTVTVTQEAAVVTNTCETSPSVVTVDSCGDPSVTQITVTENGRGCVRVLPCPSSGGASDDFNRPDGPAGSNWAWQSTAGVLRSGSLGSPSTGLVIGWWLPGTFPPDQFSEATVSPGFATPENYLQVFVRRQDSGFARYGFHARQVDSATWVYDLKHDGISPGVVFATAPAPGNVQPGDVMRIEAQGNQIRGLVNGTVVVSGTHDTLVGGRPGLVINAFSSVVLQAYDSWRGGAQ